MTLYSVLNIMPLRKAHVLYRRALPMRKAHHVLRRRDVGSLRRGGDIWSDIQSGVSSFFGAVGPIISKALPEILPLLMAAGLKKPKRPSRAKKGASLSNFGGSLQNFGQGTDQGINLLRQKINKGVEL